MQKLKRRDFLKASAGAAAGAAVGPFVWAGEARAQWSNTPEKGAKLRVLRWSRFVQGDIDRHLSHLRELGREGLGAGERARIEGENTTLRSAERLQATDAKIAAEVLAKVYALPPVKKA